MIQMENRKHVSYIGVIGIGVFVILLAVIWWMGKFQDRDTESVVYLCKDGSSYLPEITDGQEIIQTFKLNCPDLQEIHISTVTFGKNMQNEDEFIVHAELREMCNIGDAAECIQKWQFSSREIKDNKNGELSINGETVENDIWLSVLVDYKQFTKSFFWCMTVCIFFVMVVAYGLCIFSRRGGREKEYQWAIAIFSVGLLYMFLLPPLSSPDETVHFMNANRFANFLTGVDLGKDGKEHLRNEDAVIGMRVTNHLKESNYYSLYCLSSGMDEEQRNQYTEINVGQNTWLGCEYVVSGLVLVVCRFLHSNGQVLLFAGAFANLLMYVIISFWAIHIIPYGKDVLGMIGMLPMMSSVLASYSYDVFNQALIMLYFSMTMAFIYSKKKIPRGKWVIYCIVVFLFTPVKIIYACFLVLVLAIPRECFLNKKQEYFRKGIIFFVGVPAVLVNRWYRIVQVFVDHVQGKRGMAGHIELQLEDLIHTWCNSLVSSTNFYVETMLGGRLGWLNVEVSNVVIMIFVILLIFATFSGLQTVNITQDQCFFYRVVLGISLLGMFAMATVIWWDKENSILIGLQGRYFVPYLCFLPFVIGFGSEKQHDFSQGIIKYAMCGNVLVMYEVLNYIFIKQ